MARRRNLQAAWASRADNPLLGATPTGAGGSAEAAEEATAAAAARKATVTATSTPAPAPNRAVADTHFQASPETSPNSIPQTAVVGPV